tara:strand:+ start:1043 stop:1327 length:285 start_codon:yes stop_codon:yes gene_type:complete
MKFSIGQLVWIASSFDGNVFCGPPAIVVSAYKDYPKIFLHNEAENRHWLEEEDIGEGWVYDVMHNGSVEEAVLEEWLVPFEQKKRVEKSTLKKE